MSYYTNMTCFITCSDVWKKKENEVEAIQKFAKGIPPMLINLTDWSRCLQGNKLFLMMVTVCNPKMVPTSQHLNAF